MELRRYWLEFKATSDTPRVPFGCGVTAANIEDALDLVAGAFCNGVRPTVTNVVEDVDVGDLADELARRVRPVVIGPPFARGIWYPKVTGP